MVVLVRCLLAFGLLLLCPAASALAENRGVSIDGSSYLIPADIKPLGPDDADDLKWHAVSEDWLARGIRGAGARSAIMIFDACRNNPFAAENGRALGETGRGLARLEASEGMFTLYSARQGQTALDRLGSSDTDRNSVFTRVFVKALQTPGINISTLGDRVRDDVAALARSGGQNQVPAVYNDLLGAQNVFQAGPLPAPSLPAAIVPSLPTPSAPSSLDAELHA